MPKLDLAMQLSEKAWKANSTAFGPEDPNTLISKNNLGMVYQAAGKLDLALPQFEETLEAMKRKIGPDHPITLLAMGNLALAYQAAGSRMRSRNGRLSGPNNSP